MKLTNPEEVEPFLLPIADAEAEAGLETLRAFKFRCRRALDMTVNTEWEWEWES